ncbi:glycosyltransferase family 2 protein [Sphingomonas solaris]|uniref:Glycosyltransferase n=1 Tax=Alterirhizorhabdus solaris TaxID=2529389 RepID=A0A558RAB1_9SPHN|nr:glycosyltransferase family 2 protein [Sphingomonas solaris]TVV76314.1 glycosyltransferase [Sphingomonas solaris]
MTPDVSLLICTRDRSVSLAATLASVARAAAGAGIAIEVVVVDNGSGDDTANVATAWCAAQPFSARLLTETRPGLARARNAGLAVVRGRIVAMTDDDCRLHPGYFPALVRAFAGSGGPAIIGGRILPGDPADLPVTLKLEDHPMIADPGRFPGGFVMGANLAFTADVPARVGPFDEQFGAGAPFVSAEDTDFLFRATRLGIALLYDPCFVVDHHHGRRRVEEETRLLAGYGFGDGALYAKHLLRDRRVLAAIGQDLDDLKRDATDPVTTHAGIRRFYAFRLRHKARGFLSYAWRSIRGRREA